MATSSSKRKFFRVGRCSRLLLAAALFWVSMQMALVPSKGAGSSYLSPLRAASSSISSSFPRKLLYVHIGKTGGEWIKSQLSVICKTRKNPKVKQACLDSFQNNSTTYPRTQLSSQTIGYLHVNTLFPRRNAHSLATTHYLFSVRHPLSRLDSWFVYNHPRSCDPREGNSPSCKTSDWKEQFFRCFPTLADIGRHLGTNDEDHVDAVYDSCSRVLWDGWLGRVANVKEPNHLYWNYQFYWNQTILSHSPNKPILAVRQEHLVSDMNDLELFLQPISRSSDSVPATGLWRPADSTHFLSGRVSPLFLPGTTADSTLAITIRRNLCCALLDELTIYQTIVEHADNLQPIQKSETLQEAYRICGVTHSWTELQCPPSTREKRTSRR